MNNLEHNEDQLFNFVEERANLYENYFIHYINILQGNVKFLTDVYANRSNFGYYPVYYDDYNESGDYFTNTLLLTTTHLVLNSTHNIKENGIASCRRNKLK